MVRFCTILVLAMFLVLLVLSTGASSSAEYMTDIVKYSLTLPDNTEVNLPGVFVQDVIWPYAFISDHYGPGPHPTLAIYLGKFLVERNNSLNLTGIITTFGDRRVVIAHNVEIYADSQGTAFTFPVPFRGNDWDYMLEAPQAESKISALDYPLPPDPPAPANPPDPITAEPGTISGAKLTGGVVELAGKVVTGVFHTSDGDVSFFYIQEPMVGGNGIKIVPELSIPIEPGNIVTVKGVLISDPAEVYIYGNVKCTGSMERPGPAGMINLSCAGGEFGEQTALYMDSSVEGSGLNAVGTRVRVWGSVLDTGTESGHALRYIDDGSALSTGTYLGLKVVYWDADDAPTGQYIDGQTGILGAEIVDGKPVPVVRVPEMVPYEVPSCVKYVVPDGSGYKDGSSWNDAFEFIQDAIDAAYLANPKCEVWVAGSETPYYENIIVKAGVAVYGGFSIGDILREQRNWTAHETIIDGSESAFVVSMQFENNEYTRIDGFTLQNARGFTCGSGITCGNNAIIANNRITGNYEEGTSGGGITCSGNSLIWNNTITGNTAYQGGGIYCSGSATITNNVISQNTAYDEYYDEYHSGGGIYCSGNAEIKYNQIINNTGVNGGGILCDGYNPVISCNVISGNTADSGSGIYCNPGTSVVKMTNNAIIDNSTDGIYCDNRTADIINNTIAWNGTGSTGDGMRLTGTSAEYRVINNIVYDNCGAGIRGVSGINIELENNDVYDQSQNYLNLGTVPASNISQNPLFDTTSTHNVHLLENSPCIDEGLNDPINIGDQDIDGEARIMDNQVDIGADEFTGCVGNVITLSPENPRTVVDALAHVQATVKNFMTGEPVSGVQVDIEVNAGEIEKVTRNGNTEVLPDNTQSTYGTTDSNGVVDIYVAKDSEGEVDLNASISQCVGTYEDQVVIAFDNTCTYLTIAFDNEEEYVPIGTTAYLNITVKHSTTNQPICYACVDFWIDEGQITSISPYGNIVSQQTGYGFTDNNGNICIGVTRSTSGYITVNAVIHQCSEVNDQATVYFYDPDAPADIIFVVDRSESMGGHEAAQSVGACAHYIFNSRSDTRFGVVMFNELAIPEYCLSINDFNDVDTFCNSVIANGGSYGKTNASIHALNLAAEDLENYSPDSRRRYVAFITDEGEEEFGYVTERLQLVQRLEPLTLTGGGVFVSLWEDQVPPPGHEYPIFFDFYAHNFTNDDGYPSLAINGGFDPVNYPYLTPAEDRYLFTNLKNAMLGL